MGIALSDECCHVADDDVETTKSPHTTGTTTRRHQHQPPQQGLPAVQPEVASSERGVRREEPRHNPLHSPTKDTVGPQDHPPAQPTSSSLLHTPNAVQLMLTSDNSDATLVSSMDYEPRGAPRSSGRQANQQQQHQQQQSASHRSPTKSSAKFASPLRANAFATIQGVPMATLASTVFIHQDEVDAPQQQQQLLQPHHQLPYVFNAEELDFAADDEAEEETAVVMGERICRGASRHRLNGSQVSGTYSVDLGSQSSRRRSRESAVTWDRAIFPCAADDDEEDEDDVREDSVLPQPDEAPHDAVSPAHGAGDVMGISYNDDVVFPTHNVFTPPLRPAAQAGGGCAGTNNTSGSQQQLLSLQDGDVSMHFSLGDGGRWSEAELEPIIASPRRERQRVVIPSHLMSSGEDGAIIQPPLTSPTTTCDLQTDESQGTMGGGAASPRLWELPHGTHPCHQMSQSLDEEVPASALRVVKHVALKTKPLDWSSGRAPRRPTLNPGDVAAQQSK